MSIIIKSLKNFKKIGKELKKVLKEQLNQKPNSIIGLEWKEEFSKITNNLKKINNLNWFNAHIFPLYFYLQQQRVPLDKDLIDNFIGEISIPSSHYEDISKLANKLTRENKSSDLFLFENLGGVDLLIFFIDSRGNFAFNDYESKKSYLNKANNGSDLISIGIKSILNAKKIICFCVDEASKDIVFKLNKKVIDSDDLITYLQLHNDITLYTLRNIINKSEINNDSMTQDKTQFIRDLDLSVDEPDLSLLIGGGVDEHQIIEEVNLESFNQNMNNLDDQLFKSLSREKPNEVKEEKNYGKKLDNDIEVLSDSKLESVTLNEINKYKNEETEFTDENEENKIEQNIYDIQETTEEIIEQVYEIESNVEDVKSTINHIENEIFENGYHYESDFIYIEPNQFEFKYEDNNKKHPKENFKKDVIEEEFISNSSDSITNLFNDILINDEENFLDDSLLKNQSAIEFNAINENDQNLDIQEINENLVIDSDIDQKEENILLPSKEEYMISINNHKNDALELDENIDDESDNEKNNNSNKVLSEQKRDDFKEKLPNISEIPSSADELYKYITIKNETLKHIEKLLLNNKLGIKEEKLLEKMNKENILEKRVANREAVNFVDENKHISSFSIDRYKLTYVPGFRPVPLLMVWNDINKNFFDEISATMMREFKLEFDNNIFDEYSKHIWNDGCYIIYNEKTLMIRALAFESIDRLVYLLRHINKKLTMRISTEKNYKILSEILKDLQSEIKVEIA